jgi:tetratricopeptide (TPR) repeat protein
VFENTDGSPQIVTAAQIAQSLNDCRVPIFVLNACKSAQEGDGSFSSVATRLVSLGAKGIVAMAYNVQVQAAKHFIGRFYQQLVVGYAQLGRIAQDKQKFDEAIGYYKKAFTIYQKLQDWYKASITLVRWGNALEAQEKWLEALQIYTHFLPIKSEYAHELIDLRLEAWARILNHLGETQFEATWLEATGEECEGKLREAIWRNRYEN